MPEINKIRFFVQYEWCECKCRFNYSAWNSKEKWNHNEYCCECKQLNDWNSCQDDYIWNPSTCNCECNKPFKIDECLDIRNCASIW